MIRGVTPVGYATTAGVSALSVPPSSRDTGMSQYTYQESCSNGMNRRTFMDGLLHSLS
jgi:hypothetical protein